MEQMTITRTAEGGLAVRLETQLSDNGSHLVMHRTIPWGPALGQLQILELQADLMAEALRLLEQRLQAARQVDQRQSRQS